MKNFCEKCHGLLERRPHRRTPLCDKCYAEKRKSNVAIAVKKIRKTMEKTKVNKMDVIFKNYLGGLVEIIDSRIPEDAKRTKNECWFMVDGIQKPKNLPAGWSYQFPNENQTKFVFELDQKSDNKRFEAMLGVLEIAGYFRLMSK